MNKRVVAVVAAGVLALAGVVVLLVWASNADRRAYEGAELTQVVQVRGAVEAGTEAADLATATEVVEIPASTVPEGAVTDLATVSGLVTGADLVPGEILLESRMVDPKAAAVAPGGLPKGLQEMAISLETAQLVSGTLQEGDRVGIVAGYLNPEETVFIDDQVLVLGSNIADLGESAQGAAIIRVAVDGEAAKKLAHAGLFGKVWLTKQNDATKPSDGVIGREDVTR